MEPRLFALGLIACGLLTSCMVESDQPLTSPETSQPDPQWVGDWRSEEATFHVTAEKGPWLHVVIVPDARDEKTETYEMFPSIIGADRFLNVHIVDPSRKEPPTYLFFRYRVTPKGQMRLWLLSEKAVVAAIKAGKVPGEIRKVTGKSVVLPDYVTLTGSSGDLARFIQQSDLNTLFPDETKPLKRIKPSSDK